MPREGAVCSQRGLILQGLRSRAPYQECSHLLPPMYNLDKRFPLSPVESPLEAQSSSSHSPSPQDWPAQRDTPLPTNTLYPIYPHEAEPPTPQQLSLHTPAPSQRKTSASPHPPHSDL